MKNQNTKQIKLPNGTVYERRCNGGAQHQKGRDRWTEGQTQTLMRLAMTGISNKEIAEKMNRSYSSIIAKRQFLGITKKAVHQLKLSNKGLLTPESIADMAIKPEKQPRWTNEEVSTLVRLVTAGLTNTEIARSMGRTVNSIREMRKRSNLPGSRVVKSSDVEVKLKSGGQKALEANTQSSWKRMMSTLIGAK